MIYDVLLDKILVPWDGYNKHRTIRGIYVGTGLKTVSVNSQSTGFPSQQEKCLPTVTQFKFRHAPRYMIFFSKM